MAFDDLLANGKTDPGTVIFLAIMKPLENTENPLEIFLLYADAVICDLKLPIRITAQNMDLDLRSPVLGPVLQGVADEVLE